MSDTERTFGFLPIDLDLSMMPTVNYWRRRPSHDDGQVTKLAEHFDRTSPTPPSTRTCPHCGEPIDDDEDDDW